jgi:hypothetical protein
VPNSLRSDIARVNSPLIAALNGKNSNGAIEISIPITINRKVLFGDCDPEGIVYTPRFSYFALEATHEAMHIMLGAPSITALKKWVYSLQ